MGGKSKGIKVMFGALLTPVAQQVVDHDGVATPKKKRAASASGPLDIPEKTF
jgi:hypothetical protein